MNVNEASGCTVEVVSRAAGTGGVVLNESEFAGGGSAILSNGVGAGVVGHGIHGCRRNECDIGIIVGHRLCNIVVAADYGSRERSHQGEFKKLFDFHIEPPLS